MKEARLGILNNCLTAIQEAYDMLQVVHDEEEEAFDNMSESFQDSERGDRMQEAIDTLDEAVCSLEEAIDYLQEVTTNADDPLVMEIDPWQRLEVGDTVTHKSFGSGKIAAIKGDHYTIDFAAKTAIFIFPDAVDKGFIIL